MQIKNVFKRELYAYFASPVAYIFLIFFLVISGWFTFYLGNFFDARQADLRAFFYWHPWLYLFFMPAIAMRVWSEERKSGTVQLLFTLPITIPQAVIGKFLAVWIFHGIALILTLPIVLTVYYLGQPDGGVIFCSYLGSFLMAGAYLAIGTFASSISKNQVISFILSMAFCFAILLTGLPQVSAMLRSINFPVSVVDFIVSFSFLTHFESIQRGVIDFSDIFYFISVIVLMLVMNTVVLEAKKAS